MATESYVHSNEFPKGKHPFTLLHGKFSLTEHALFARSRRGKPPTFPVCMKRYFRFAILDLPESISLSAQLSTFSLVSLASFLPASASDYSSGKSVKVPPGAYSCSLNVLKWLNSVCFPTHLKTKLNPRRRDPQKLICTTKPPNRRQTTLLCWPQTTHRGRFSTPWNFQHAGKLLSQQYFASTISDDNRSTFIHVFSSPNTNTEIRWGLEVDDL